MAFVRLYLAVPGTSTVKPEVVPTSLAKAYRLEPQESHLVELEFETWDLDFSDATRTDRLIEAGASLLPTAALSCDKGLIAGFSRGTEELKKVMSRCLVPMEEIIEIPIDPRT